MSSFRDAGLAKLWQLMGSPASAHWIKSAPKTDKNVNPLEAMKANTPLEHHVQASLDGIPVALPSEMKSFRTICSHLSDLAHRRRRVIASLSVEIEPIYVAAARADRPPVCCIAARTASAATLHLGIVQTALRQVEDARLSVREAAIQVQVNEGMVADQQWRALAAQLQQPLETMRALPEGFCDSTFGQASPEQLRQWQFEQLNAVRNDMDEACRRKDERAILHALENRVMSWLDKLSDLLSLWRETLLLAFQTGAVA